MKLRDYQEDMLQAIRSCIRKGQNKIVAESPTGSGKTTLLAHMIGRAAQRGKRPLFTVPAREILIQTSRSLQEQGISHGIIASGFSPEPHQFIQLATIQTLARRLERVPKPDFVVIDECFPAGTLIDGRPIETIMPGEKVFSFNQHTGSIQKQYVTRTFKKRPSELVVIYINNGEKIICTPNHPIFTNYGWIQAGNISAGTSVLIMGGKNGDSGMLCVWDQISTKTCQHHLCSILQRGLQNYPEGRKKEKGCNVVHCLWGDNDSFRPERLGAGQNRSCLLLRGLQKGIYPEKQLYDNGSDKQETCFGTNEEKQSGQKERGPDEDKFIVEKNRTQTKISGREWKIPPCSSNKSCTGIRMANGSSSSNKIGEIFRIPNKLQTGYCQRTFDDCIGSGWQQPLCIGAAETGPKENKVLGIARVDRVEIQQPGSNGKFGELCPDGYVYNLEVAETHTFFANGVLVHNCHHSPASQWRKLWDVWPDTVFIGLTATPWRLDGKGLGNQFETMVKGPSVRELIDRGHLSDYVVYAPPVGIDTSSIKTSAGDFAKDQLAEAVDKPTITGNAVAHYKKIANGKRAVVAAISIEHSKHITAEFNAAGIYAVHLDGCEDQNRRDHIMNDFAAGRIQVLSQVGIVNEGVDIPGIEAVISLRPTKSLSLWLQFIGRALRPAPGKDKAIILDHAGNTHLHGLPCDEREWSLEGSTKQSSGKKNTNNIQVKQCPGCYACHAPADRCPSCGHLYHKQEREVEQVDGELQAVDPKVIRLQRQQEVKQAQTLEELQELGKQRGYKPGWAHHVWKARQRRQGVAA